MKTFTVTLNEKQAKDLVCWVKWTKEEMKSIEYHWRQRCDGDDAEASGANNFKEMMDSVLQLVESLET
jgi:hypothetical protein